MSKCFGLRIGVAAFVLLTVAAFAASASADLVAYYNFDDGTVTNNGTAGSVLNGTVSGATLATGKYGGALSFDGTSSYAVVNNNAALNFTSEQSFTMMAWVNVDADQSGMWHTMIAQGRDVGGNWYGMWACESNSDGTNYFNFQISQPGVLDSSPITTGTWYNVAFVQNGTEGKTSLYVNGNLANEAAVSLDRASGKLFFGAWFDGTNVNEGFKGQIDEFKLFNTALTGSQIQSAMTIPEPSTIILLGSALAGLLCYAWRKKK